MKIRSTVPSGLRLSVLAIAAACALVPAQAGFLDDFYSSAGANGNMTPGGIYEGQSSIALSGGGFTYRTPNRSFNPVTFSPPSFNAGCGGIDIYLGAMGFPSSADMTAFLRNIGQAAGGIAFDIALKALSPELSTTITNFSKDIQAWTKDFKNSCKAATALIESTSGKSVQELQDLARKNNIWTSSDYSTGAKNEGDMQKQKEDAKAFVTANPNSGLNPQRNLVWEVLNSGDFAGTVTDQEKRFIMAITGTVVFQYTNESDASSIVPRALPAATGDVDTLIEKLVGDKDTATVDVPIFQCTNVTTDAPSNLAAATGNNNCLIATLGTETISGGFRYRLEQAKNAVVTGIRTRQALTGDDMLAYGVLHNSSALPILKVVQASALQRNNFIGDATVSQYLDIAAREMAIKYLKTAVGVVKMTANAGGNTNSKLVSDESAKLLLKATEIDKSLESSEKNMRDKINNVSSTLTTYESVRKYMLNTMSADLTRSRALGG